MAKLINPRLSVKIYGEDTMDFKQDILGFDDLHVTFDIVKDLDEEPNEATVTVYNLNSDYRNKLASPELQLAPIEIYLTPHGVDELVLAFSGNIDLVQNTRLNPGHETTLYCLSQQLNHRAKYIDRKTFSAGTLNTDIIDYFLEIINLPRGQMDSIPPATRNSRIKMSQSFNGPAFPLLARFVFDLGMYAYILDGKIHVTHIYEPENPVTKTIETEWLLATPESSSRQDARFVKMQTFMETVELGSGSSIFDVGTKRKKRTKQKKQVDRTSAYVEYDVVDKDIPGVNFEVLCQPDFDPDYIVSTPTLGDTLYRVTTVNHYGTTEDFSDWTTVLETDEYEDPTGALDI